MNDIILDDIIFTQHENVKQYWFNLDNDTYNFIYYNQKVSNKPTYILLYEHTYHTAFSHWFYDSAIFLSYFNKLNEIFDNKLKIFYISKPNRKYKKLLFNFFNIKEDQLISCNIELPDQYKNSKNNKWMNKRKFYLPHNNICIKCPIININNLNMNFNVFKNRIRKFRNLFLKQATINEEKINYLFFPRNKIENLKHNDRIIDYKPVYDIIKDKKYLKYDTMKTDNIIDQVNLLINSKNIFLDYGSSLWVNGLFCKNANIYVSKNLNQHRKDFWYGKCFSTLLELVEENNNIIFIS